MNPIRSPSKHATSYRFVFTAALILAAIAIGSGSARGQTFDCRGAHAADEVTICHDPSLAKLDQDLAALRRQRNEALRGNAEDDEVAFLNARRRCGKNRGCIEQSYRNRIQELGRSLPKQVHQPLWRIGETRAHQPPHGRDSRYSGFVRPPQPSASQYNRGQRSPLIARHEILSTSGSPPVDEGGRPHDGGSRTAQTSHKQHGLGIDIRQQLRGQVNSGLVTIILGGLDSGDLSDATDLVTTVRGAHLRILPVAGEGAAKDLTDLLFARGIDIAVVQTDVLASLKRQAPFPGIENFLQYISKLYDEEVHILVGPEIHSLEDLASKPVNFGPLDSGTFLTASAIFGALGIGVEIKTLPQPLALDKLRRGEIAASVYTAAKPARLFQAIRPEEGLHFLSISAPDTLRERYGQVTLSAADYPGLIEESKPVSTLAVGTVLAVYNWPAGTERYRNVAHFVETFFGRLAELRMSRNPPKWREVDINASVPGWRRFAPASEWIKTAEQDREEPTRVGGPPLPMQGSTTSPAQMPSVGAGEVEPIAEPAINHPNSVSTEFNGQPLPPPTTASPKGPEAKPSDQTSSNAGQLDGFFRAFLEYQKWEAQKTKDDSGQNDALFAEFQTYVKQHLPQPDRPLGGPKLPDFDSAAAMRE